MVFHAAARSVLDGHAAQIFDGAHFTALLNHTYHAWLSQPLRFRPWVYPPTYLLLVLPFGLFGFLASFVLFQLLTAGALAAALLIDDGGDPSWNGFVAVAALVSPAASVN